jgi:hypothetical protein
MNNSVILLLIFIGKSFCDQCLFSNCFECVNSDSCVFVKQTIGVIKCIDKSQFDPRTSISTYRSLSGCNRLYKGFISNIFQLLYINQVEQFYFDYLAQSQQAITEKILPSPKPIPPPFITRISPLPTQSAITPNVLNVLVPPTIKSIPTFLAGSESRADTNNSGN